MYQIYSKKVRKKPNLKLKNTLLTSKNSPKIEKDQSDNPSAISPKAGYRHYHQSSLDLDVEIKKRCEPKKQTD